MMALTPGPSPIRWERGTLSETDQLGQCHQVKQGIGAGVEDFVGKEGGVFVGRDAAVFLEPLLFVDALGFEASEEGFARFFGTGFFVDAFDDAFLDGFLDRDFMEGPGRAESKLRVGS